MITYANLGKYYCPNCDFKRPELAYQLTQLGEMTNVSSVFTVDEESYKIEVGGLYNIYNALTAAAVGQHYGVSPEKIRLGLSYDEKVFGRQEVITIGSKKCTLVLVKNPVGLNQVIDTITLSPNDFSLVCLLNANYADGLDVSWIWDGSYEHLTKRAIPQVLTGGDRREDMTFRLQVAGLAEETIHECANSTASYRRGLYFGNLYSSASIAPKINRKRNSKRRELNHGQLSITCRPPLWEFIKHLWR